MSALQRYGYEQVVHYIVKPIVANAVLYASNALALAKTKTRYDQLWVRKLHHALTRTAEDLARMPKEKYADLLLKFAFLICTILDVEPYWGPRWYNALLKRLSEQALLKPVPEVK